MSLGNRIKEARKNANLTQKQLGEYCGVKDNTVSDWENDKSMPDADTIEIICKTTKTEPNILLDYELENLDEVTREELNNLTLENVLVEQEGKIKQAKNLPIEKQKKIANAIKSVLDMIDEEDRE